MGPQGIVAKGIIYSTDRKKFVQSWFWGLEKEERGELDDLSRSNNGDRDKQVLATVAFTAIDFT